MQKSRYIVFLLFVLLFKVTLNAQTKKDSTNNFSSPFNFPLFLSGSFGELRSNHFHGGIDIKTGGVTGKIVKAVKEGYVSRIKISPWGYGKALYITHPNGLMSVYGHLRGFTEDIEKYVKEQQYLKESFSVNLFPDKNVFKVKKGQIIAYSGNSGSSGGPHLHLEIREKNGTVPLNPLGFGFKIKDNIAPLIKNIAIYPENDSTVINGKNETSYFKVLKNNGNYVLKNNKPIEIYGDTHFGIFTYDKHDGSHNKNGVYEVMLLKDNDTIYHTKMDAVSFKENAFLNSYIDFGAYKNQKKRYQRTIIDPMNLLRVYRLNKNNGVSSFVNDSIYSMRFIVSDFNGNQSDLEFDIYSKRSKPFHQTNPIKEGTLIYPGLPSVLTYEEALLKMPANCFYKPEWIKLSGKSTETYPFRIFEVGSPEIPCYHRFVLSLAAPYISDSLFSKTYIARVNKHNKTSFASAKREGKNLILKSKSFGKYTFAIDTIQPVIKPISVYDGKNISKHNIIRFKIYDRQSGIKKYTPTLNGKWLLMEYDAKKSQVIYKIDHRLVKGRNKFELQVEDNLGNIKKLSYTLYK
ncbi:MAG: M23 family metallopeptidase [Bacteroidales bacterium]